MAITGSVGQGGGNSPLDVLVIQELLNEWRLSDNMGRIMVDGLVGTETLGAIRHFQQTRLGWADGRVDPGGQTQQALLNNPDPAFPLRPMIRKAIALVDGYRVFIDPALDALDEAPREAYLGTLQRTEPLRSAIDAVLTLTLAQPGFLGFLGPAPFLADVEVLPGDPLTLMLIFLIVSVLVMMQNPAFRHEVDVRARELARQVEELRQFAKQKIRDLVSRTERELERNGTSEERCRASDTFTNTPECAAAINRFMAARRAANDKLRQVWVLLTNVLNDGNVVVLGKFVELKAKITELLVAMREFRNALQDMRIKCTCLIDV